MIQYAREELAGRPLTPQEVRVLRLAAEGMSDSQIAEALSITRRTAGFHIGNILRKLAANNRTTAANEARRRGLL